MLKPVAATLGFALMLTGCTPAPTADEIEEQFAIEVAGVFNGDKDDPAIRDIAKVFSDNAPEDCHNATMWRLATTGVDDVRLEPWAQYVHAAGCLVVYGDAIEQDLRDDYVRAIAEHVAAQ